MPETSGFGKVEAYPTANSPVLGALVLLEHAGVAVAFSLGTRLAANTYL